MRYIALKQLRCVGADGVKYTVSPGDPVPEFASWTSGVRFAHLAAHMVRDTEALAPTVSGGVIRMEACGPDACELPSSITVVNAAPTDCDADALPYRCEQCDHPGFTVKNSLMQHIKRKH